MCVKKIYYKLLHNLFVLKNLFEKDICKFSFREKKICLSTCFIRRIKLLQIFNDICLNNGLVQTRNNIFVKEKQPLN